jgi:hypothetical protein
MTPDDAKLLHHGLITLAKSIDGLTNVVREDIENVRFESACPMCKKMSELAAPAKTELAVKELGL